MPEIFNRAELQARIDAFPRWHYEIDLGHGVRTPIHDPIKANRHRQRKHYFFDYLVDKCSGNLQEMKVLDLGCNAGFWMMHCLDVGCESVTGIDARQMHVKQAKLVLQTLEYDPGRYDLVCSDLYDVDVDMHGPFDIVLCLGLLYHVSKPVELIERITAIKPRHIVVDTSLNGLEAATYTLKRESLDDPRNAADRELVMVPSKSAVEVTFQAFGYDCQSIRPDFTDYSGAEDYERGRRLAFHCTRSADQIS